MSCTKCKALAAKKDTVNARGDKRRACDACGKPIPVYVAMGGAGFQAHSIDHEHLEEHDMGNGQVKKARTPVHLELCHECYLKDFAQQYPGQPLPDIANVRVD